MVGLIESPACFALFFLIAQYDNYLVFLVIITQGNKSIIQKLAIHFYGQHIAGNMLGVLHLYLINGFFVSIADLKSIPGRRNDRIDIKRITNFVKIRELLPARGGTSRQQNRYTRSNLRGVHRDQCCRYPRKPHRVQHGKRTLFPRYQTGILD